MFDSLIFIAYFVTQCFENWNKVRQLTSNKTPIFFREENALYVLTVHEEEEGLCRTPTGLPGYTD